jgi:hypothetical protein
VDNGCTMTCYEVVSDVENTENEDERNKEVKKRYESWLRLSVVSLTRQGGGP